MVKNANSSDNFLDFLEIAHIARIANNEWGFGFLTSALDASNLTVFSEHDFIYLGVEHVCATVDSAESGEGFWKTS
jgi:hypothetical protein